VVGDWRDVPSLLLRIHVSVSVCGDRAALAGGVRIEEVEREAVAGLTLDVNLEMDVTTFRFVIAVAMSFTPPAMIARYSCFRAAS
jgi:hypothetical protein